MKDMGLCPVDDINRAPVTRVIRPKGTGNLFNNSAVYISNGEAVPCGTGNTDLIAGSVTALNYTNQKSAINMSTNEEGTVTFTTGADAFYRIKANGVVLESYLNGAKNANLTAETGTTATLASDGSLFSLRQLDISTLADTAETGADQRQLILMGVEPVGLNADQDNLSDGLGEDVYVIVKINPANFQATA